MRSTNSGPATAGFLSATLRAISCAALVSHSALARQGSCLEGDAIRELDFLGSDVAAGDFDQDGWNDLAVVDQGTQVHVMLATGPGEWAPRSSYPAGVSPQHLVTADLDGDGDLDLVSSNLGSSDLSVLLNQGDGTFGVTVTVPVTSGSSSGHFRLTTADVDGDQDVDVIVVTPDKKLRVVPNLGGGTFGSAAVVPTGLSPVESAAAGDLDGDGTADLVLGLGSCTNNPVVAVWFNQGAGTFVPGPTFPLPGCATSVRIADVDGDQDLDFAVAGPDYVTFGVDGHFRVYRNLGAGAFGGVATPPVCEGSDLRLADIDADGDLDGVLTVLSTYCVANDSLMLCRNEGGQFGLPQWVHTTDRPSALDVADFDRDSDADVVAVGFMPPTLRVHFNRGDGSLSPQTTPVASLVSAVAADFDGDGDDDVATLGGYQPVVTVRASEGDGTFSAPVDHPCLQIATAIAAADVDSDLDLDLLVAGGTSSPSTMRVLFNSGGAYFTAAPSAAPIGIGFAALAAGDLDGDGDLDAVATNVDSNNATVLANDGSGGYAVLGTLPFAGKPAALALADYDGNGTLDLAVARLQGTTFFLRLNQGQGVLGPTIQIPVGSGTTSIAALDIDGDSDPDLALTKGGAGPIAVFRNAGGASFALSAEYPVATGSTLWGGTSLASLDVDADGDLDLATAVINRSAAYVLRNDGTGSYTEGFLHPGGAVPALVLRARLDGDGDDDLVLHSASWLTSARNCTGAGEVLCTGEGPAAPCPCGNTALPGTGSGCVHSSGSGGSLRATGSTSLSSDRLVLLASTLPSSTLVLFFQGTSPVAGGPGTPVGDGLRCAGGSLIRLGTRAASDSAVSFPDLAEQRVSAKGGVTSPGTRYYQAWFRDPVPYCTPATFNLTNGLRVVWAP